MKIYERKKSTLIDVKLIKNGKTNNNLISQFPFVSIHWILLSSFFSFTLLLYLYFRFLNYFFIISSFLFPPITLHFPYPSHYSSFISITFFPLSSFSAVALLGVFPGVAVVAAAIFLRPSNAVHHCNSTRCITFPTPTAAKRPNTAMSSTLVNTNPKDAALDALLHVLPPIVVFLPLASRIA